MLRAIATASNNFSLSPIRLSPPPVAPTLINRLSHFVSVCSPMIRRKSFIYNSSPTTPGGVPPSRYVVNSLETNGMRSNGGENRQRFSRYFATFATSISLPADVVGRYDAERRGDSVGVRRIATRVINPRAESGGSLNSRPRITAPPEAIDAALKSPLARGLTHTTLPAFSAA